jgi:hypothetical protein
VRDSTDRNKAARSRTHDVIQREATDVHRRQIEVCNYLVRDAGRNGLSLIYSESCATLNISLATVPTSAQGLAVQALADWQLVSHHCYPTMVRIVGLCICLSSLRLNPVIVAQPPYKLRSYQPVESYRPTRGPQLFLILCLALVWKDCLTQ